MAIEDQIIGAESGGDPYARNPMSSATGAGQFIDSTWLDTIRRHRPDLAANRSPQELLAMRTDPALSRDMTRAYAADNADFLRNQGLEPTPGNIYLAHFAGPKGAAGVLGAPDSASVGSVLGDAAVRANPFLAKMTVGDLRSWAARKAGSDQPATGGFDQFAMASAPQSQQPLAANSSSSAATADASGAPDQQTAMLAKLATQNAAPTFQNVAPLRIDYPEAPGITRARALIRAMALRPLAGNGVPT
jgi:hypothetical protein